MPSRTFSKLPNLVISLYLSFMIVSKETLILSTPFIFNSFENFFNKLPFVVSVISFKLDTDFFLFKFFIRCIISFLTKGSPPVSLIFSTPKSIKLSHNLSISSKLKTSVFGRKFIFSFMQ